MSLFIFDGAWVYRSPFDGSLIILEIDSVRKDDERNRERVMEGKGREEWNIKEGEARRGGKIYKGTKKEMNISEKSIRR